jgi:hypothetical protein
MLVKLNIKRPPPTGANPRTLAGLFLIVVGLPAIALVWLSTHLIQQDRSLAAQREMEVRQGDLQSAARELEKFLAATAKQLPHGAVGYEISPSGIRVNPRDAVLWFPVLASLAAAGETPFVEAERAEFRGNTVAALSTYQTLAQEQSAATIQAGALLRAARIHWREERWNEALQRYDQLARIPNVGVEGLPADFVARRATCDVLRDAGRKLELQREAEALRTDLLANRWTLDRVAWEQAASQIASWTGRAMDILETRRMMSELGVWLWEHRSGSKDATQS